MLHAAKGRELGCTPPGRRPPQNQLIAAGTRDVGMGAGIKGVLIGDTSPSYGNDTLVQAWRNDAVNLDGRLLKLRRNIGQSVKIREDMTIQKEISLVLATGKGASAVSNLIASKGFATSDEALVVLSLQLDLAQVCHRKLDALAKTVFAATGGQPEDRCPQTSLLKIPESLMALLDRALDLHDECVRLRKGGALPVLDPAKSELNSDKERNDMIKQLRLCAEDAKAENVRLQGQIEGLQAEQQRLLLLQKNHAEQSQENLAVVEGTKTRLVKLEQQLQQQSAAVAERDKLLEAERAKAAAAMAMSRSTMADKQATIDSLETKCASLEDVSAKARAVVTEEESSIVAEKDRIIAALEIELTSTRAALDSASSSARAANDNAKRAIEEAAETLGQAREEGGAKAVADKTAAVEAAIAATEQKFKVQHETELRLQRATLDRAKAAAEEKAKHHEVAARSAAAAAEASQRDMEQSQAEVEALQKLVKSLQQKLKDLAKIGNSDTGNKTKGFSDTFEEVMQEEMAAMKFAFERKLRGKQEQIEAMQRAQRIEAYSTE